MDKIVERMCRGYAEKIKVPYVAEFRVEAQGIEEKKAPESAASAAVGVEAPGSKSAPLATPHSGVMSTKATNETLTALGQKICRLFPSISEAFKFFKIGKTQSICLDHFLVCATFLLKDENA